MSNINILTSANKSFRIFRLLDKNDSYFERNVKIKKPVGTLFMPFVASRTELGDIVQKFFGTKGYSQFFPNYYFNYKFMWQPALVPGRKVIMQNRVKLIKNEALSVLPRLRVPPTFKVINNKNAIIDYTDQYALMCPRSDMMQKQPVLKYSENIFPEMLTRYAISYEKPELFKWTSRYVSSQVKPYLFSNYSNLIIPIEVDITQNSFINLYIDYDKKIPLGIKKNIKNLKLLSLVRMIYRAYANDTNDISSPEFEFYLNELINHNVIFFFYNKRFAFSVNFMDLRERKMNSRQFRNMFKSRLIMLISNNMGIQSDDSMDQIIEDDNKEDEENPTHIEKNLDLTIDPTTKETNISDTETVKTNDHIVDDTEEKRDKEINSIINNTINKKVKVSPSLSYKKKSEKLLKLLNKETDNDIQIFDQFKDEDKAEPIEDKLEEQREKLKKLNSDVLKSSNYTKVGGIDIIESVTKPAKKTPMIDDSEDEEYEQEIEEENKEESRYDENGFLVEDEGESIENIDEEMDDVSDEVKNTVKKIPITVSSDGNITEEEKKAILKEINKRQMPKRTEAQLRRIELVKNKYKSIKLEDDRSLEDLIEDVKAIQIETKTRENKTIIDKTICKSNLQDFEKSYVKNAMQRDIVSTLKSFDDDSKSIPLHMTNYEEENTSDRFNAKKTISVDFEDDNQKRHHIKFDIPMPDQDGIININGTKKILKKQITLRPLVKINPSRLAITTFYNKVLMYRQGTILNRKVVLLNKIIDDVLVKKENTFSLSYGNNIIPNKNYITTIEFDELAKIYHKFIVGKKGDRTVIFFNQKEIRGEIKKLNIIYIPSVDKLPLAIDYPKKEVIEIDISDKNKSCIDYIMDIIHEKSWYPEIEAVIDKVKAPKRRIYTKITVQSFDIPLITFLSALFGLSNILRLSGLKYKFTNERLSSDAEERSWLTVKFKNGTLYYPEYPFNNSLLFNGLNEMVTEDFDIEDFDDHLPYMDYCAKVLKTRNVFKGWTAFRELFIDAITKEILEQENLPTDFLELFLYANDLLTDNSYNNETEAKSYRIRSFELLSVALYKTIANEYRKYIQKEGSGSRSITIDQNSIMKMLTDSQLLETYDTINPMNELKMKAGCSVKGNGLAGANTKHGYGMDRRAFGEDCVGIFAEANVDNHNVGIVKELTNNVNVINTRGFMDTTKDPNKISKMSISQRLAPEELIMPTIDRFDHPNRVGFSSGQWKHTMPIEGGGDPPFIGNGYENEVINEVGSTYAVKAKKDGTIEEINEEMNIIIVANKDGTKDSYRYNKEFLKNGNINMENNMSLNVKVGQKVKEDDILAYSKEFFTKTPGGNLTFTMGRMCRVVIMDDYFTEEDSSLVTEHLSKHMATSITHTKTVSISGKANIVKMCKIGDHVKDGEPLMLFEDERDEDVSNTDVTQILSMLGNADESAIERISYHAPKANASGVITKIEAFWTGDPENMSESAKKFVSAYITDKKKKIKYEKEMTGVSNSKEELKTKKVTAVFGKVNGIDVDEENGLVIEFYITHSLPYGPGDKLSFYPAIKSVTMQVVPEELCPYAEDGKIDAVMGLISMSARQVNSPYFLGTLGKLLYDMSKRIAGEYLGKK